MPVGKQWRGGSPLFAVATVHAASRAGLTFATSKQLPGAYGGRGPGTSGLSAAVEWGGLHWSRRVRAPSSEAPGSEFVTHCSWLSW